jgi:hypothetical protein
VASDVTEQRAPDQACQMVATPCDGGARLRIKTMEFPGLRTWVDLEGCKKNSGRAFDDQREADMKDERFVGGQCLVVACHPHGAVQKGSWVPHQRQCLMWVLDCPMFRAAFCMGKAVRCMEFSGPPRVLGRGGRCSRNAAVKGWQCRPAAGNRTLPLM